MIFQIDKFYEAWHFIQAHPKFQKDKLETFPYGLDIDVVKVNPVSQKIEDYDKDLDSRDPNTHVKVWLEYGPYEKTTIKEDPHYVIHEPTHDIRLDCGADTFEEAIIELAKLIKQYYGDYEPQKEDA